MNRSKHLPKYRLPLPLTLLAAVLLAGCITLLVLWCQPNALRTVLSHLKAQPLLIVLNALPIGLLLLLFTSLFRNVFFSAALVNFAVCCLSIANRIKIEVRDEPVFPRDLALLKEVASAMGSYDIHFPWGVIGVVVCATLALVVLGIFVGCKPFPIAKLRGWLGSILGAAASLAVLTALILTVYASNDLYNSFKVTNAYYVPSVFNDLGFPYCFCHHFTTYEVDRPEGFHKTEMAQRENEAVVEGEGKAVNVVMVMNEAFSDISDQASLSFAEDPLPNLHAMQADPHAITGHLVVPGFAGGTANTEFDVMTGVQTNALSATTTSAMRVVNRAVDSVFRVFGADGYHTSYFHPGDDWFYNRENVLRWMGAEETVFIDQMESPDYKGRWVTDDYAASLIESEFEQTMAAGENLFHFTTTIQNHMSYTADKYGADYAYPAFDCSAELSDTVRTMLEVYTEGARDADAMLGRLKTYFAAQEEPVVLVFFGDHLPYLGDNQLGYSELGLTTRTNWSELTSYETPYVIWANDAAAEMLDWENAAAELDLPETISAAYLGAAVIQLTGRIDQTPWFRFLDRLRREFPVVQKGALVLADGSMATDPDQQELIQEWRQWSYYKLKYQEFEE